MKSLVNTSVLIFLITSLLLQTLTVNAAAPSCFNYINQEKITELKKLINKKITHEELDLVSSGQYPTNLAWHSRDNIDFLIFLSRLIKYKGKHRYLKNLPDMNGSLLGISFTSNEKKMIKQLFPDVNSFLENFHTEMDLYLGGIDLVIDQVYFEYS